MSNPNDPIDPETGRGKKEDGWKTVVIKSPFAQGNQDPQTAQGAPGQPPPANYGQPQGGYPPAPPQASQPPAPPSFPPAAPPPAPAAPSFDKTQVYTHAPFAPPAAPPASDKTQVYTQAPFPPAPQKPASTPPPPPAAAQGFPPPPPGPGNFNPPAPGGGGYAPPPPPGGFPPGARPPQNQPFPQQYGAPPQKKKSKVWLWVLLSILGVILLCVVGCIGFVVMKVKKGINSPDLAIVVLHARMSAHQDAELYDKADEQWKATVPRATSDAMFDRIYQTLGTPMSYEISGKPSELSGDLVQVEVNTTFTLGKATETITFHKSGKGLKLYQYSIHGTGPEIDHERVLNP